MAMRGLLLVCLGVAAACSTTGSATSSAQSPSTPALRTEACLTTNEVEAALVQFASAFNSGDEATIRATLSTELWALSFTVGGRHEPSYGREDVVRCVLARQSAGDRLEFIRAQLKELAGWDGAAQVGPLTFSLRRGDTTFTLQGKGAL